MADLFGTSSARKSKRSVSFNDEEEEFTYTGSDLPVETFLKTLDGQDEVDSEAYDEQMEAILGQEVKPEQYQVPREAVMEHMPDTRIEGAHVKRSEVLDRVGSFARCACLVCSTSNICPTGNTLCQLESFE